MYGDHVCSGLLNSENRICRNTNGSYQCPCVEGKYDQHCSDIDECKTNKDVCIDVENSNCTNTEGSFECRCRRGFAGPQCQDINECTDEADVCSGEINSENRACANTNGSYNCPCLAGNYDVNCSGIATTTVRSITTGDASTITMSQTTVYILVAATSVLAVLLGVITLVYCLKTKKRNQTQCTTRAVSRGTTAWEARQGQEVAATLTPSELYVLSDCTTQLVVNNTATTEFSNVGNIASSSCPSQVDMTVNPVYDFPVYEETAPPPTKHGRSTATNTIECKHMYEEVIAFPKN
ncbi:pro-epidermal growth factor-like [Sycon ciliatum]|uniref:pro-epidermal growth factor-like n=1 Tax=Sycon ciliatum TaxID=27933 RepID=UPI0031F68DE8